MFISRVEIFSFRNIRHLALDLGERTTLVTGRNGQGKTSLVEAIYLLTFPRSFRPAALRDLIPWLTAARPQGEEPPAARAGYLSSPSITAETAVFARIRGPAGERELAFQIQDGRKESFSNGKRGLAVGSLFGQLRAVVFTPDDLQLVKGSPQPRRQFLDRTLALVEPEYLERILLYQRVLRSRNAVLAEAKRKRLSTAALEPLIHPWDEQLLSFGEELVRSRLDLEQFLKERLSRYYAEIAGTRSSEPVGARLESSFIHAGRARPREEVADLLARSLTRDLQLGTTHFGVHRDDLVVSLGGDVAGDRPARLTASQGQSRSLALALKLASVDYIRERTQENPVLLLDDVESELDAERRRAFAEVISSFASQTIITATEVSDVFAALGPQKTFRIEGGAVVDHR